MSRAPDDLPRGNVYDKYGSHNPIERRLMATFFDRIDGALPQRAQTILEVGTGEGEILDRLVRRYPSSLVVGLDLPDDGLAGEWRAGGYRGIFGDGRALPFADHSFDLVVAIETLEHISGPEAALAELARVCRGSAVLSVPREPIWRGANMARGKYWGKLGNTPGHVNHWSSRSFSALVAAHFDIESVRRPFPWTVVRAHVR